MIILSSLITGERRRWVALAVVCMGQLMMVLDATIVNVALPSMQRDLGFSQANLAWVVDAYMIAFGSFLLLAGRLGDLLGRKRMFLTGLVVFTLASVVCGVAGSQGMLIAARFVQGLGGAVASAAVLALLVTEFPQPHERAIALSVYTFIIASGGSIGLLAGGVLTQAISWHWIFFINVPIGIVTFALGRTLINETERLGLGQGVDVLGSVLVTVALMLGLLSVGVTARLMERFGPTRVLLAGLTAIVAALLLLSRLPAHTAYFPGIFGPFALLGLGAGLSFLPLTTMAMAEVPSADAGLASGIVNASLQIAGAIGVAALGTVAAERTKVLAGLGQHHLQALTGGFHLAWAIGAGAVAIGALVTLVWLRPPARSDEVIRLEEHEPVEFQLEAA